MNHNEIALMIIAFIVVISNQIKIELKGNKTEEKLKYFKKAIEGQTIKEKIIDYSKINEMKYSEIVDLYKFHKQKLLQIDEELQRIDRLNGNKNSSKPQISETL